MSLPIMPLFGELAEVTILTFSGQFSSAKQRHACMEIELVVTTVNSFWDLTGSDPDNSFHFQFHRCFLLSVCAAYLIACKAIFKKRGRLKYRDRQAKTPEI